MGDSETIRYRGTVISANREGPQQRYETVADDARLQNVLYHGLVWRKYMVSNPWVVFTRASSSFRKKYGPPRVFLDVNVTEADGMRPRSFPRIGLVYSRVSVPLFELVTTDEWNPNTVLIALTLVRNCELGVW